MRQTAQAGSFLPAALRLAGMLLLWGPGLARGNPGHEVTIAELNVQIAATPGLPELYFQRAYNYRELQMLPEARADWAKCLELQPGFLPASRELARADALEGRPEEGIARLRKAMAEAPRSQDFHRPGCHSVLGELLLKQGKNAEALAEAEAGLRDSPNFLMDLCLLRSEAQRRLGKLDDRVRDLAAASAKLPSFVVKAKWYDAMTDAGRGLEILPEIEDQLANTRYQSSWLIRRARIRLKAGDKDGALEDLKAAEEEIAQRLHPERPDASLLCDRGVIQALRGNAAAATADLKLAQEHGADYWMTLPLVSQIPEKALEPASKSGSGAK